MLSSLASYLFGSGAEESTDPTQQGAEEGADQLKTRPAANEWVLVEKTRPRSRPDGIAAAAERSHGRPEPIMECSLGPLFRQPSESSVARSRRPPVNPHSSSQCPPAPQTVSQSTGNPPTGARQPSPESPSDILDSSLCLSQGLGYHHDDTDLDPDDEAALCQQQDPATDSDVSSVAETVLYPSLEESWLVTPPACFTAGPARVSSRGHHGNQLSEEGSLMETSSLENLLIEHPSMSVYSGRLRHSSTGMDSEGSASDPDDTASAPRTLAHPPHHGSNKRGGRRKPYREPGLARQIAAPRRPSAVAARAGLTQATTTLVHSMQTAQQRNMYKNLTGNRLRRANLARQVKSQAHRGNMRGQGHLQQPKGHQGNNRRQ